MGRYGDIIAIGVIGIILMIII
ncbi:MAG: hypothetical protein K0R84_2279, partial [Clostridia bacterium]|nr:hypothetical protein [Clostridia bacterium]